MKRKKLRWTLRFVAIAVAIPCLFVGWRWGSGNLGTVTPGRIYRSAQPTAKLLSSVIRQNRINTVLNLRGSNPDQAWYQQEKQATLEAGATLLDFPMSSDQWLSHDQIKTLLDVLDTTEYPILIHCEWGAERTGLVAAICALLKEGSRLENGRAEFSAYYLFLPVKDGLVMRGHLQLYERWLAMHGETHSPKIFRVWLTQAYEPGKPSREHWPCNPYPLKVETRQSGEAVALWSESRCK
jgi:protein tyrosine phosphatase (PTP) superfamily phosphohydrolase (DUF442 family)